MHHLSVWRNLNFSTFFFVIVSDAIVRRFSETQVNSHKLDKTNIDDYHREIYLQVF